MWVTKGGRPGTWTGPYSMDQGAFRALVLQRTDRDHDTSFRVCG